MKKLDKEAVAIVCVRISAIISKDYNIIGVSFLKRNNIIGILLAVQWNFSKADTIGTNKIARLYSGKGLLYIMWVITQCAMVMRLCPSVYVYICVVKTQLFASYHSKISTKTLSAGSPLNL